MNSHKEMERVKEEKRVCEQTYMGDSEREFGGPPGGLNPLYRAFLLGLFWPIILLCLILSPDLVYLSILPHMHMYLLAKMDSREETYG